MTFEHDFANCVVCLTGSRCSEGQKADPVVNGKRVANMDESERMRLTLYTVRIKRPHGARSLADIPLEADYPSTAKTMAGHILRGFAVRDDDFTLICIVHGTDGEVIGHGSVIREGAAYRGANQTGNWRWGIPKKTAAERKAQAAQFPRVNKVVWK